mmetsp:Transcript_10963/g.19360  ORF Transcript_10963/g.19360 Transcript_10963/m.19360 type:complete len:163 (-) Transcript_10963:213-701(-)
MNATFPDYDFSGLKPDQFVRENLGMVINAVNTNLSEIVHRQHAQFLDEMWGAIDQEVDLKTAAVFSYVPDLEEDPFNVPGSLWSFNYFFHDAAGRKMLFLTCCCTTSSTGHDFYGATRDDEDYEFNDAASDTMSNRGEDLGDLLDARLAEAMDGMESDGSED